MIIKHSIEEVFSMNKYEVNIKKLRKMFNEKSLKFKNTSDLNCETAPFGQKRAIDALSFALSVKNKAFNIYVTGPTGTGKTSMIKNVLKQRAEEESPGFDYLYVNHFSNPTAPVVIKLSPGAGSVFKEAVDNFIKDIQIEIPKAMESPIVNEKRMVIIKKYQRMEQEIYQEITNFTRTQGFTIEKSQNGIIARPLNKDGDLISEEEYAQLDTATREDIEQRQLAIQEKMDEAARHELKNEKAFKKEVAQFEENVISTVITPLINELKTEYKNNDQVSSYFDAVRKNIFKHSQAFLMKESTSGNERAQAYVEHVLAQHKINLFIDRAKDTCAPVVFETNPTYNNLFGWIEHEERNGYLSTDFNKIKPGAIHRANSGYLVIQVVDLLKNPFAYDDLKRALRNQHTKVGENPFSTYSIRPLKKLEPEAIELDVKVILIGSSYYFSMLNHYDEEFARLFKIKADFDSFVRKNDESIDDFLKFIALRTRTKKMLPLNRGAVAEMIDYSTRLSGQFNRLSARLSSLEDILWEADHLAKSSNKRVIARQQIEDAIKQNEYRHGRFENIIRESIYNGTIMIDVDGEKIGEINGLAVYQIDDYAFGVPSKITSRTFAGKGGVINIEREANLSGSIHDKGVAILSGYIGGLFQELTPLNLTASISFEQNYGGVDGDSASSTETYAILSALSGFPINQSIAVTGSVNQMGQIQPIGGVNEKIEGFFEICKHSGLTGKQGVMIPHQNIKNLMLKKEIVEAVKAGQFKIYAVKTIQQGMEILTGQKFGNHLKKGGFTKDSVLDKAYDKLLHFVRQQIDISKKVKNKKIPSKK